MKFNSNSKKPVIDSTVPTKEEERAGMKQLEKYATQPDSRGAWNKFVEANKAEQKDYRNRINPRSNLD